MLVRLHPYEYMFYNPLVGGLEGAARRYEMDYWVNMMPEAVRALQDYLGLATEQSQQRLLRSASAARNSPFDNYADKRLQMCARLA